MGGVPVGGEQGPDLQVVACAAQRRGPPGEVVAAAMQEDVDVVGVSLLSGSHVPLFKELGRCLKERGAEHIFVVAGGVIPERDYPALWDSGVDAIVPQEARADLIVTTITYLVAARGRI